MPNVRGKGKREEILVGSQPLLGKLEHMCLLKGSAITSSCSKEVVTLQLLPHHPVFKWRKKKIYLQFYMKSSNY